MNKYSQLSNNIFDYWMAILSPSEFKVFVCICRKTYGWHKTEDHISLSQIANMTGLSRKTIVECIGSLEYRDLFKKVKNKTAFGDDEINLFIINKEKTESLVNKIEESITEKFAGEKEGGGNFTLPGLGVVEILHQGGSVKFPHTKETLNTKENLPTYILPSKGGLVGFSSEENLAARQATESKADELLDSLPTLEPKPIPEPVAAKPKQDAPVAPIPAILESLAIPREEKERIAKHLTDITLLQRVIDYLEIPEIKVKINSMTGSIFHYYHNPNHMKKNIKKAPVKPSVSEGENRAFLRGISNLLVTEKIRQRESPDKLEMLDERGTVHKFYFRDGSFIEQLENFLRKIGHWHAQLISFFRRFRESIGLLQPQQSYG